MLYDGYWIDDSYVLLTIIRQNIKTIISDYITQEEIDMMPKLHCAILTNNKIVKSLFYHNIKILSSNYINEEGLSPSLEQLFCGENENIKTISQLLHLKVLCSKYINEPSNLDYFFCSDTRHKMNKRSLYFHNIYYLGYMIYDEFRYDLYGTRPDIRFKDKISAYVSKHYKVILLANIFREITFDKKMASFCFAKKNIISNIGICDSCICWCDKL